MSLCAFDVIYLVALPRFDLELLRFLGSGTLNIINLHLISNVSRRSEWPLFHLSDIVFWVQGISADPLRGELHTVWLVNCLHIVFGFVQANVKRCRT